MALTERLYHCAAVYNPAYISLYQRRLKRALLGKSEIIRFVTACLSVLILTILTTSLWEEEKLLPFYESLFVLHNYLSFSQRLMVSIMVGFSQLPGSMIVQSPKSSVLSFTFDETVDAVSKAESNPAGTCRRWRPPRLDEPALLRPELWASSFFVVFRSYLSSSSSFIEMAFGYSLPPLTIWRTALTVSDS